MMNATVSKFLRENRGFLMFIGLMLIIRSAIADWNDVPTGSMLPTIQIGDRILVNKTAYDIRLPFTDLSLLKTGDPERGEIVVFNSAASGKRLVKRVIGLPGDTLEMRNNQLMVNSIPAQYSAATDQGTAIEAVENWQGDEHMIRLNREFSLSHASFGPITVPADHYFVMGDNRDNSADSRVIGFVPRQEIIGRSSKVVVSLNYDNYFLPRSERFWKVLD